MLDPISRDFERDIQCFVKRHGVAVHRFEKGERKDVETQRRLRVFDCSDGVLYLGTAQEKQEKQKKQKKQEQMRTIRTQKRRNPATGAVFPWLVRTQCPAGGFVP